MTIARALGALFLMTHASLAQEVHFSPEERLDAIDAALIATAKSSIDLASYALTDPIVINALNDADHRGVVVRIVLDPRERHDFVKLGDLSDNVRIKRGGPYMHLKAYAIDGERLRTGQRPRCDPRRGRGGEVRGAFRAHVGRGAAHDRVRAGDQRARAEVEL